MASESSVSTPFTMDWTQVASDLTLRWALMRASSSPLFTGLLHTHKCIAKTQLQGGGRVMGGEGEGEGGRGKGLASTVTLRRAFRHATSPPPPLSLACCTPTQT